MAKAHGPEEFFEVFGSVKRKEKVGDPEAEPAAEEPQPAKRAVQQPVPREATPPVAPAPAPPVATPAAPRVAPPATGRKFPMSVFAEEEPKIPVRRSTLIFAAIIILVSLFIAYALGKRAGKAAGAAPRGRITSNRRGMIEVREPAQPERLRHKWVVCMKVFDHTQHASEANARKYRSFLTTAPDAAFIKARDKEVFVASYQQKLFLCVGPFDHERDAELDTVLPRLRALRIDGVQQFDNAGVEPLPQFAKLFEYEGDAE